MKDVGDRYSGRVKRQPPLRSVADLRARHAKKIAKALTEPATPTLLLHAVETFEQAAGGRQALTDALLAAPDLPPVQQRLVEILVNPKTATTSLHEICSQARISPAQLYRLYRDARLAKAQVDVVQKVANRLHDLAEDILRHCVRHDEPCPTCHGIGTLVDEPTRKDPNPAPVTCHSCAGKGVWTVDSSLEHQKLALSLLNLGPKPANIQVNTQVNTGPQIYASGGLEDLQKVVSHLLAPKQDVEGEVIEAEASESAEGVDA